MSSFFFHLRNRLTIIPLTSPYFNPELKFVQDSIECYNDNVLKKEETMEC